METRGWGWVRGLVVQWEKRSDTRGRKQIKVLVIIKSTSRWKKVAKSVRLSHKILPLSQTKRLSLSWNNWTALKAISWTFGRYDRQTKRGGRPGVSLDIKLRRKTTSCPPIQIKYEWKDVKYIGGYEKRKNKEAEQGLPLLSVNDHPYSHVAGTKYAGPETRPSN